MKKLNIGIKLLGMVMVLLLLMLSTSGYGILKINAVNQELKEITEYNNPLSDLVAKISITQLNQAVLFEKILFLSKNTTNFAQAQEAWKKFEFHSKQFYQYTQNAFNIVKIARRNSDSQEQYEKLFDLLEEINNRHLGYENHVKHSRILLSKKKSDEILPHMKKVEQKKN
jgi:CHASE3 domain sensor protein